MAVATEAPDTRVVHGFHACTVDSAYPPARPIASLDVNAPLPEGASG